MDQNAHGRPKADRRDFALQLWFFVLAIASIMTFFLCRSTYPLLFQSLGIASIIIRIAYYIKQMLFTKKS